MLLLVLKMDGASFGVVDWNQPRLWCVDSFNLVFDELNAQCLSGLLSRLFLTHFQFECRNSSRTVVAI